MTLPQTRHKAIYAPKSPPAYKAPPPMPHEPEENELQIARLLEALVEAVDDAIGKAVTNGLGDRVRGIVAKHLPPEPTARPPQPDATGLMRLNDEQLNRMLTLFSAKQVLEECGGRLKPGSTGAQRLAVGCEVLRAEIERLKGGQV